MWIVRLALRRPYTFTVMAILIILVGIVTIARMSTDIFPSIDIPVVSVIWSYSGVAPEEMEKRFVTVCERAMTTTVNDIEHIESQSYNGVAVIKVFFYEGAKVEAGVAQITSICQTLLRTMPPGTTPPLIIQYSASNVPILQLGLSSQSLSEQQLYDLGLNFIRTQLSTVQGAQVPLPYGGKARQIMVDIESQRLLAKGPPIIVRLPSARARRSVSRMSSFWTRIPLTMTRSAQRMSVSSRSSKLRSISLSVQPFGQSAPTVSRPSGGWSVSIGTRSSIPSKLQKEDGNRGQTIRTLSAGPSGGKLGSSLGQSAASGADRFSESVN